MTAMQELVEDLKQECKSYYESNEVYLKACIEQEKQQIISAWDRGQYIGTSFYNNHIEAEFEQDSEQYYNLLIYKKQ